VKASKLFIQISRLLFVHFFSMCLFVAAAPASPIELNSDQELMAKISEYRAVILFLGYGSKSQYKDIQQVLNELDESIMQIDKSYGRGKWIAVFGGDGFKVDKPDIAHVMKHLKYRHGVPLLAIQSDIVKQWGGVDAHIDFVRYVPTVEVPVLGPDGTQIIESGKPKANIFWGGFIDDQPRGPTGTYLGPAFLGGPNSPLKQLVVVGGGPISLSEAKYAYEQGVEVIYHRAEAKYPEINGQFGSVDAWAQASLRKAYNGGGECTRWLGILTQRLHN
jgi:hypothetical protein